MFDLPVVTKKQRKLATGYRNHLLDMGFEMAQFSVYARHCYGHERVTVLTNRVAERVPPAGKVDVLVITDVQYRLIQSFRGQSAHKLPSKGEQLLLV